MRLSVWRMFFPCCYVFRIDCFTPAPPEQVRRPFKNIDPSSLSFNVPLRTFSIHYVLRGWWCLSWVLPPPLMIYHGVCTIRWMTWMTDWITRITILHHSIPLNACNKPKTYSLYLPFLCRIFMREKVWYEFDAELNHLWDYNWILIFHKAADKCLPCPFYLLPDRRIKRPFIKIWLIWVHLTY